MSFYLHTSTDAARSALERSIIQLVFDEIRLEMEYGYTERAIASIQAIFDMNDWSLPCTRLACTNTYYSSFFVCHLNLVFKT